MCITFFYINPRASKNEYRLIIAANRDESFHRRATPAHFWDEDNSIIGGRDLTSPSQGTWLGASKKGKIGILLNIDIEIPKSKTISRGVLISNFLKGNSNAYEFCQKLTEEQHQYRGFHLVLFDLNRDGIKACVQTNSRKKIYEVKELKKGYHGFSNSPDSSYKKLNWGKSRFEEIVEKYNDVDHRETLLNEILSLLKSEKKHYPDQVLQDTTRLIMDEEHTEKLSSVFVNIPEKKCGTRTHSIITVTQNNDVDFNEYTMKEPMNFKNQEWIQSHFLFKLSN